MKNILPLLLILLLGALLGWFLYGDGNFFGGGSGVPAPVEQAQNEDAGAQRQPMPPRYPVPPPAKAPVPEPPVAEKPQEPPFPVFLGEGDEYLKERLPQLIGREDLLVLFVLDHFIQKLVLLIDQLPEKTINRQHLPIDPPAPGFLVDGGGERFFTSKRNAPRYKLYVELAEVLPDEVLLRLYRGLYPLFQQAYREIGHPEGYFNDRLVEVIDHLLETPEPQEPIPLVAHIRRYKYADDKLEALSAGQKILLRMGQENARRIKVRLRVIHQELMRRD